MPETMVKFDPPLTFRGERYQKAMDYLWQYGRHRVMVASWGMDLKAVWFPGVNDALLFKLSI